MDEKLAERGPVAAVGGQLANTQKKCKKLWWIQMWMAILTA